MSELKRTDKYNSIQEKMEKIQLYVNGVKKVRSETSPPPYNVNRANSFCDHYHRSPDAIPVANRRKKYSGTTSVNFPEPVTAQSLTKNSDIMKMRKAISDTRDYVNKLSSVTTKKVKEDVVTETPYWVVNGKKYYTYQKWWEEMGYKVESGVEKKTKKQVVTKKIKNLICPDKLPIDGEPVTDKDLVRLSHYNSMLQAANAVVESMKRFDKLFDKNDRCHTQCQVYCQQACQAACQNVSWCHDQKCGVF